MSTLSLSQQNRFMITARPLQSEGQKSAPSTERTLSLWDGKKPMPLGHPFAWVLERTEDGVRIRSLRGQGEDFRSRVVNLSSEDLNRGSVVRLPQLELTIRKAQAGLAQVQLPLDSSTESLELEKSQNRFFHRLTAGGLGAVVLLGIISTISSILSPAPQVQQDVIPPQFAKLLLKKPKSAGSEATSGASGQTRTAASQAVANAPESVKKSAMVKSLSHASVQNAMSSLLKGGMSKLLKESQFVSGQTTTASRALLSQTSGALSVGNTAEKLVGQGSKAVQGIGGGSGGGTGIGYDKGGKAGVKGQGGAFVSLDLGGASVEEGLTKDEVGEVIHRHIAEVRYCYESTMVRNPDAEGKLLIQFTILKNGTVKSADVKNSTVPDPRLDDCVVRRLLTWKFPNPKGGVTVTVAYPFIFKPLGK